MRPAVASLAVIAAVWVAIGGSVGSRAFPESE